MDPILLQKQLKENSVDLQDFCNDLKKWGEDMKSKEHQTKPSASIKQKTKTSVNKESKRKIGTTDYGAWDKFDVDAECEKIEDSSESELTDETDDDPRDKALLEKENGNKFVKLQKWDEAIKCYTKAITYYSFDPIFYANRALCYLKKSKYAEAEEDCNLALKLDKTYVKAYQRRAASRESMGKLEEAEIDYTRVLEIEPKNKESKKALDELRNRIKIIKKDKQPQRPVSKFTQSRQKPLTSVNMRVHETKPSKQWPSGDNIIPIRTINKPPHQRSKKPLCRIEIKETNAIEYQKDKVLNEVIETQEIIGDVVERTEVLTENIKNDRNEMVDMTIPKNAVQFYANWKYLKSLQLKYQYLKLIKPESIPGIFKESIESGVFSDILQILCECFVQNNESVYGVLYNLTNVRRFSALVMFMESEDRNNLWKLIDYVKLHENKSKDDVDFLMKSYELSGH